VEECVRLGRGSRVPARLRARSRRACGPASALYAGRGDEESDGQCWVGFRMVLHLMSITLFAWAGSWQVRRRKALRLGFFNIVKVLFD